jgi:hypothetical protein
MLFILAMEPLNKLFEVAMRDGLMSPLHLRVASLRTSFYADDAVIFLNPVKEEVGVVAEILHLFGTVSGPKTNRNKCVVYPINCTDINLEEVLQVFQCPVQSFPCSYLGFPLHTRQLCRVDFQPLIDKMENMLPMWKGRFLNKAWHLKLLNSVLSSMPTYMLTAVALVLP